MEKTLPAVIDVDKDKCISCHSCISNCPVKFCNDASGDYVSINHNLCIGCGNCIKHCSHGARSGIDDFEVFLSDVGKYPFIAIVAPAAAANFGDVHRLNGYLRSIGVAAFFDVSFGAELTIKSYLTHVKENSPKAVISQPCPAIVSYIEIFRPGLIKHLAPADSPMLHTIKMVREYYPNYASSKIVMISPCYAKKREFEATCDFGEIYNVTMKSLGKHFDENAIDVESFPPVDFENPPAERGVMFSTPGGLLETAKRDFPGIENLTRKIEGSENIYPYLDSLESAIDSGVAPLVIDCLNCAKGCNQGAGTITHSLTLDHVDYLVSKRKSVMIEKYSPKKKDKSSAAVNKVLEKYWKKGLYSRQYKDLSSNLFVTRPDDDELKKIFASLNKFSGKDIFDCTSCGYNKCEKMAFAIHNGLNKPDNCYHFKESQLHDREEMSAMLDKLKEKNKSFRELSSAFEMMLSGFEKHMAAVELSVEKTSETMKFIISANDNVHGIINMVNEISFHTNILSLNAAIEAARAGNAGKSFAVVAGEVRSLSLKSTDSADDIRKILNSNTEIIKNGSENVDEIIRNFKMIQDSINSFSDIIKKMNECFSER